jgi:menaquinol-cytochrome c reductase iron-sulfur subunit
MCPSDNKTNEPENPGRRKFLAGAIAFLGGIIALVLGGSGAVYFLSPSWRGKKDNWVEAGPEAELPEGQPVKKEFIQRATDGWVTTESGGSVWLLKEKGTLTAFNPHCTHLGCPYRWDPSKNLFLCPCHNGVFDKSGKVVSGPPPRGLDRYPVKVENGVISILPEEAKS